MYWLNWKGLLRPYNYFLIMNFTVLSKELLDFWSSHNVKASIRQRYLRVIDLSTISSKTDNELSFMSDCAYVWTEGSKCTTMKWEEFDKLCGSFSYISARYFKTWFKDNLNKPINHNTNENRLQKQETHVVRGDDGEGNRVQSRKCKASVTVGYLSNKAIKG